MPHPVSAADLEMLWKFDTPTVCNVVELFDLRPRHTGYMNSRIQASGKRDISGFTIGGWTAWVAMHQR
jgi:hypothetical protein